MNLKEALINYRKEHGISQREFARRSGLSNSLISILEMGVNPQTGKKPTPDPDTYKKIATGMGISVQSLFETLGDSELVDFGYTKEIPVFFPDTSKFQKFITYMSDEDYKLMFEIFARTEKKIKERGIEL